MKLAFIRTAGIEDIDFDDLAVMSGTSALFAHDSNDFMPKYANLYINNVDGFVNFQIKNNIHEISQKISSSVRIPCASAKGSTIFLSLRNRLIAMVFLNESLAKSLKDLFSD